MNREDLLHKLETVEPALSTSPMLPKLNNLWFTGRTCMAADSKIAISVPLSTDFKGGVHGDTLIRTLRNSGAAQVEFSTARSELVVKAAKAMLRLPLDTQMYEFTMPKLSDKAVAFEDQNAIRLCLRSTGGAVQEGSEAKGITLTPEGVYYATDNTTITRVKGKTKTSRRVTMAPEFCKHLIGMGEDCRIDICDNYVIAVSDKVSLHGQLIQTEHEMGFDQTIKHMLGKDWERASYEIPPLLRPILERALVVLEPNGQASLTVADGVMKFHSLGPRGEVRDSLKANGQKSLETKFFCGRIRAGLDDFKQMLVTKDCTVLHDDGAMYIISATP